MNFKDFFEFLEVIWIVLDFMACSSLFLAYYVSFLVFSVLSRVISIVYIDCFVFGFS